MMCKCLGLWKVMCKGVGVWEVMCKCVGVWKVRGKYGGGIEVGKVGLGGPRPLSPFGP